MALLSEKKSSGLIAGRLHDNTADCQLRWEEENINGNMKMHFNNGEIEAVIDINSEKVGKYVFRPLKIEDVESKECSYTEKNSIVQLNNWGKVKFMSRVRQGGKHNVLEIYLANLENILKICRVK